MLVKHEQMLKEMATSIVTKGAVKSHQQRPPPHGTYNSLVFATTLETKSVF